MRITRLVAVVLIVAATTVLFAQSQAIDPTKWPKSSRYIAPPIPKDPQIEKLNIQIAILQAELRNLQSTDHECTMQCCRQISVVTKSTAK